MDDVRAPDVDAVAAGADASRAEAAERKSSHPTPTLVAGQAWLAENQVALDAFDRWYEDNGSPLDKYRAS